MNNISINESLFSGERPPIYSSLAADRKTHTRGAPRRRPTSSKPAQLSRDRDAIGRQIRFEHPVYRSSDIPRRTGAAHAILPGHSLESVPRASSSRFHRPFFSPRFLLPISPTLRRYPPPPPAPSLPLLLLRPFPFSHTIRAGALIMRGFRRSRFHSFLRLRHREMIIGTWPMWSVHTRNETTSRRYPSGGARRPAASHERDPRGEIGAPPRR